MRARNIKPGFFKNEELADCNPLCRILFAGLWCMADREGRLEKRPLRIKAEILPYDSLDVNGELTVLERKGFITTYVVDGKEYLQINHFIEHQRPHHTEAASKLPSITDSCILTVNQPLDDGENPPDSLIPDSLIPDSLIPDSLIPDSHPLFYDSSSEQMTMKEFASCYQKTFGKIMSGMLNQDALDMCRKYPAEVLHEAFRITAEAGGKSFSYLRAVLEGQQKSQDALDEVFGGAA